MCERESEKERGRESVRENMILDNFSYQTNLSITKREFVTFFPTFIIDQQKIKNENLTLEILNNRKVKGLNQ